MAVSQLTAARQDWEVSFPNATALERAAFVDGYAACLRDHEWPLRQAIADTLPDSEPYPVDGAPVAAAVVSVLLLLVGGGVALWIVGMFDL